MSLVNNIKGIPTISNAAGGQRKKYTVSLADIQGLGAFTTGDVIIDVLPPGSIVTTSRIKHSASVAGAAGPISAATARLMFGATALGAGAIDVYAAPSTTDSTSVTGLTNVISPSALGSNTNLVMRITQTGATTGFTDVTAGSIDAWVDWKVML